MPPTKKPAAKKPKSVARGSSRPGGIKKKRQQTRLQDMDLMDLIAALDGKVRISQPKGQGKPIGLATRTRGSVRKSNNNLMKSFGSLRI